MKCLELWDVDGKFAFDGIENMSKRIPKIILMALNTNPPRSSILIRILFIYWSNFLRSCKNSTTAENRAYSQQCQMLFLLNSAERNLCNCCLKLMAKQLNTI